jgi:hypothetical protein
MLIPVHPPAVLVRAAPPRGLGADPTAIALGIQQQEGYYPGSVAYTNNNPGNLVYVGQSGATGKDTLGFAVFPDYATGFQALVNQVNLDMSRGLTFDQFTAKYAPAGQGANNPSLYAQNLATAVGLSPSDLLSANGTASDASLLTFPTLAGVPTWAWMLAAVAGIFLAGEVLD